MWWSPQQLADLAGTSRRAVRHYQDLGLLPEPERRSNGYQRYGVDHLLRLLRIRRLTDLGLTLQQVAAIGDADRPPREMLTALDSDVSASIEQLKLARREIAFMLDNAASADLSAELSARVQDVPLAERALVAVLSRVLDDDALNAYLTLLGPYRADSAVLAFDTMREDADDRSREIIATGIAAHLGEVTAAMPGHLELVESDLRQGVASKRRVVQQAVFELFTPAQVDVLERTKANPG